MKEKMLECQDCGEVEKLPYNQFKHSCGGTLVPAESDEEKESNYCGPACKTCKESPSDEILQVCDGCDGFLCGDCLHHGGVGSFGSAEDYWCDGCLEEFREFAKNFRRDLKEIIEEDEGEWKAQKGDPVTLGENFDPQSHLEELIEEGMFSAELPETEDFDFPEHLEKLRKDLEL